MSFLLGIVLHVSVWTFSGDNTWTPQEWRQIFTSVQEFYKERLDVRLQVDSWRNRKTTPCHRVFKYKREKAYGNCLIRHTVRRAGSFRLLLTPPIPSGNGVDTYVGGISTGICQLVGGTAMIHGKRISTHVFKDGGNAGWEMSRLAVIHEIGHILGMRHSDYYGSGAGLSVMASDALFLLTEEFQIKVAGVWENFRDVLPLTHYNKWEAKQCLKSF